MAPLQTRALASSYHGEWPCSGIGPGPAPKERSRVRRTGCLPGPQQCTELCHQFSGADRLQEKGTNIGCSPAVVLRGICRQNGGHGPITLLLGSVNHVEAATLIFHSHIGHHNLEGGGLQQSAGLICRRGGLDFEPVQFQHGSQRQKHCLIVVDQQHAWRHAESKTE